MRQLDVIITFRIRENAVFLRCQANGHRHIRHFIGLEAPIRIDQVAPDAFVAAQVAWRLVIEHAA
jgi:hypothetical protein